MSAPRLSRRDLLKAGGALVVTFAIPALAPAQPASPHDAALGKTLDAGAVDGFFAVHRDGSVTCYSGKVDLGQGLRIALRQMVAEELGVGVERIQLIEGDTALTPDQGSTAGSTGIQRGGVQLRQAAATARGALLAMASDKLGKPVADLGSSMVSCVPWRAARHRLRRARRRQALRLALDPKAPLRDPRSYRVVGQSLPRPDLPDKLSGRHEYVHDVVVPGMLHARVVRPPAPGAQVVSIDEASIGKIPGAKVVRRGSFVGVVAPQEWDAVRAARALKVEWTQAPALAGHEGVEAWMRAGPFVATETLVRKGDAAGALSDAGATSPARYYWPMQTHGSIGPSCAVADVRADRATIWTASQGTHRYRPLFARSSGCPPSACA
jgi:CO/xanthine dehydrogenase Mo-binding subunit